MSHHIKVSVIVPIYNVEKYLDRCVKSILNQTFTDFELILVDDGSPDNCPQICDDYAKKDSRIKVIHKKNGGVSSARNAGLDVAQGEYISFVDPDDIVHLQFYEIMLKNIDDADLIYCDYLKFSDQCAFDDVSKFDVVIHENQDVFLNSPFSVIWNKLIKKNLIGELRFDINLKNGEDTLFAFQILEKGKKVIYINVALYGYFIRNDGAAASIDLKGRENKAKVINYMYNSEEAKRSTDLKQEFQISMFYNYLAIYRECEKGDTEIRKESKRFLKDNFFSILFCNRRLNIKGKIALVLNLMGLWR